MEPPERLRQELEMWRDSPYHHPTFEGLWRRSIVEAVFRHPEAESWLAVFREQKDVWRRAWEREPMSATERALVAVGEGRELEAVGPRCERCGDLVPPKTGAGGAPKRWCGERCRREASREHVAQRRAVLESSADDTARGAATLSGTPILSARSPR